MSRWRNNQWVIHEEIPEVEETKKVERAAAACYRSAGKLRFTPWSCGLVVVVLVSYPHTGLNEDRKVPQEMLRPDRWDRCKQQGADDRGGPLAPAT